MRAEKTRIVSDMTIHELHPHLKREGREVATLRIEAIHRDFHVVDIDYEIAVKSGEIRNKYNVPLADT